MNLHTDKCMRMDTLKVALLGYALQEAFLVAGAAARVLNSSLSRDVRVC